MKNQIILSTASVAAAIQAISLADSQNISLQPHSGSAYDTLAAGALASAHNQQLIQMAEHSIRTAIKVDPVLLASGYAELADSNGPSSELVHYLAQSAGSEYESLNAVFEAIDNVLNPGGRVEEGANGEEETNTPEPIDPTQTLTNYEVTEGIFAEYGLTPPAGVSEGEMFEYLQSQAAANPTSTIAAVFDAYSEVYHLDPDTGLPLDIPEVIETTEALPRILPGSFYTRDSTVSGAFGCYSNCHSACHGSRGWR